MVFWGVSKRRARANRIVPIFNLAACLLFLYVLLPVIQDSGLRLFPEASSDAVTGLDRLVSIPPGRAIRHPLPDAIAGELARRCICLAGGAWFRFENGLGSGLLHSRCCT